MFVIHLINRGGEKDKKTFSTDISTLGQRAKVTIDDLRKAFIRKEVSVSQIRKQFILLRNFNFLNHLKFM